MFSTERVARKPGDNENIVTPMNPPCNGDGRVWNLCDSRIARARSPSILKWAGTDDQMVRSFKGYAHQYS